MHKITLDMTRTMIWNNNQPDRYSIMFIIFRIIEVFAINISLNYYW